MINPITFQNTDSQGINTETHFATNASHNILITLIIVILLWFVYLVLRLIINHRFKNLKARYTWRTRAFYSILFFSVYFIGRIWLANLSDVFTFLSIVAAALTVTQKESLMNLMGCALIYWRELFHTGERIQIGNYYGEVTSIGTFYFHMLECDPKKMGNQTTGKIIKVPNGMVITSPVINLTELFPFVWQEFSVIFTPDSDVKTIKSVLMELFDNEVQHYYKECKYYLKKFVRNNFITEQQLQTQSFISLHQDGPSGYQITIRYLALPAEQFDIQSRVLEQLMDYLSIHQNASLSFK